MPVPPSYTLRQVLCGGDDICETYDPSSLVIHLHVQPTKYDFIEDGRGFEAQFPILTPHLRDIG